MKYTRKFQTVSDRDSSLNMTLHNVLTYTSTGVVRLVEGMPRNNIWYTSSNGNVVTPKASNVFGANIVSNTYENGVGIITFDGNVTSIGKNAFTSCTYLTSITIPNSVTSIGMGAFAYCTGLTSVTIGNSVTSIGEGAFGGCTGLTSVTIPNSVTSIGYEVFHGCTGLTSVTIPDSVTSIREGTFQNCTGLTSVTIPNSVTSIRTYAFYGCSGITSITSLNTTPPTITSNTLPTHTSYIISVPSGSVDTYKAAQYWSDKASQIQAIPS